METLKVQMEERKAKIVREKAMKVYGHSKGSISKAFNEAIDGWLAKWEDKKGKKREMSIRDFSGVLSHLKISSLEAQRQAVKLMGKVD